jgi:hypothetical protein
MTRILDVSVGGDSEVLRELKLTLTRLVTFLQSLTVRVSEIHRPTNDCRRGVGKQGVVSVFFLCAICC